MSEIKQKQDQKSKWPYVLLILAFIALLMWLLKSCQKEPLPTHISSSSVESSSSSTQNLALSSSSPISAAVSSIKVSSSALSQAKTSTPIYSSSKPSESNPPTAWDVEPIPGIYRENIQIKFHCGNEKKCQFKIVNVGNTVLADGQAWTLAKSAVLSVQALDSLGNASALRSFEYVIQKRSDRCPANMVPVGDGPDFCMDTYEWPNQKGAKPKTDVSLKEAVDFCAAAGKELCSSEQWSSACKSSKGSAYAYGSDYQENYCNTAANASDRSGYNPNCRSWDGVYDLSGNVWEWTSTPARNKSYNLVAGGSWDSRSASACGERKYSFFPQNQYPMVGFRCCKSAK